MTGDKAGKRKRPAFTLAEVLVAMSIFLILMTSIVGIYMQTSRFGRQVILRAKTQAEVRNMLEAIFRAARISNIDYDGYGGGGMLPPNPLSELRLVDRTRSSLYLRPVWSVVHEDDPLVCGQAAETPCVTLNYNGTFFARMTPTGTRAEDLRFYVSALEDPFKLDPETGQYATDAQLTILIYLRIRGLASKPSDEWTLNLQTAVMPRLYLR